MKQNGSGKFLVFTIAFALVLMLMVSLLGACTQQQTPAPATTPVAQPSTAAPQPSTGAPQPTTTAPQPTGKPVTIVFSSHDPKGGSWAEIYDPFFAAVEQRTNGMVKFEQHWGGELSGFFEAYDNTANRTFDMAQVMTSMYPNLFPLEDVTSIVKYDVKNLAVSQTITELATKFPEMGQAYEKSGTHLLWRVATFPNMSCMGKGKAVKTVDDLKGKKYLSTGPWDAAMWTALGMTPLSMMPDETFLNLQTGVVDGATFTLASLFDFGWGEVVPFITETNVRCGAFQCVMNLDVWNSLSPEFQQIITEEAAKIPKAQDQQQLRFDRDLRPVATEEFGTEFFKFTDADYAKMNELTASVHEKFKADLNAKGLPGTAILEEWLSLSKKYSAPEYALK